MKHITTPKGRYKLKHRGTKCLNCDHSLDISDRFCPNCSQENSTKKLSLKVYIVEFFSTFIAYDSKLIRTLSHLLFHPGKMTKDYILGKRASFTNPFRFLLSLSIIYFLLLNATGDYTQLDNINTPDDSNFLFSGISELNIDNNDSDTKGINPSDSLSTTRNLDSYKKSKDSVILRNPEAYFETIKDKTTLNRITKKIDFYNTLIRNEKVYSFKALYQKYNIPNTKENLFCYKTTKGLLKAFNQPGSFIAALISRLPFLIFFLLPIFTLFIFLTYVRKKYNYTDNLIFCFHNQSMLFILLITRLLIDTTFSISSNIVFLLIFGIYLYKAMLNFYGQSRIMTFVKYMFLNVVFLILAVLSVVLLSLGSILTY
ncbi:Protein of unknown function [Arenibacter nanhaiticus]|uniref:DUF3667 domain-containing protein n=1 Tax=Arenibacter nanhaiticus TaxID=558155 RepID=A0A1M6H8A6_9FLAO|nr:DUF3667 domain-containing protein [Arenibacter nanhaiticus]SHJ18442.1 Protein of unknown function [Arenibacter nanhaiticus]